MIKEKPVEWNVVPNKRFLWNRETNLYISYFKDGDCLSMSIKNATLDLDKETFELIHEICKLGLLCEVEEHTFNFILNDDVTINDIIDHFPQFEVRYDRK